LAKEAAKPKIIAEHTVVAGETLSGISLKYYKQTARPYWEVIYEANKAVIGDNPGMIKIGIKLAIPELPADLKK
jgi:nucleoid-associated protein YgaU